MVPGERDDFEFLTNEESEELQRRAYSRAELKAIQRERESTEKAKRANEQFRRDREEEARWNQERDKATDRLDAFHEIVVEPALLLLSELGPATTPPSYAMKIAEKVRVATSAIDLQRATARDIRVTVQTTARVPLKGRRGVGVKIIAEKVISPSRFGQMVARLKRQARIARATKGGFSLADLQYESELSQLVPWFQRGMREVSETIADVIAEEGR